MTASEKEIVTKNHQAHYAVTKVQVDEIVKELNALTLELKEARDTIALAPILKAEGDTYIAKEKKKFEEDRLKLKMSDIEDEKTRIERTAELVQLNKDIRDSTKQLNRINNSCLIGQEEIDNNNKKISELSSEVTKLTNLVVYLEEVKEKIRLLEIEESRLEITISQSKEKWSNDIQEAREQLSTIRNEAQVTITERDLAQSELKAYVDELYTNMNDWQIVRSRIEGVWNKTFPELEIPLRI